MMTGRKKRELEFKTDFTIPKKKNTGADYVSTNPLNSIYEEQTSTKPTVGNDELLTFTFLGTIQPKEVPKINRNKTERNKHLFNDPSLPQELTDQFQPLFCKLCECQHTSNITAKLHYDSKKHDKKVRKFLSEYAEKTGEPLHPRVGATKHVENDPKYFYCDHCEIPLTGKLHSESHYMSKNHRRTVLGMRRPSGRERTDCFGSDFVKESRIPNLRCQLCNVSVTSEQQMMLHINGSRHKKKLQVQEPMKSTDDTILSSLVDNVAKTDLSVFRTPTGFYYCNPCNLTLNSEIQFKQHLDSKRHKKKS
ncbi:hypothetical protein FQR65_LT00138 [Abscondita terminalis]|nr:hypothetical protein FQR65_LT00138 [Abscondita terminalis]